MPCRAVMPCGVLVLRAVAAADVPARFAEAQVYPSIAYLQTFLAAVRARRDFAYLIQMRALLRR